MRRFNITFLYSSRERSRRAKSARWWNVKAVRLLPTLLGLERGCRGCSLCCIRTMNYATRSASEYTRPSSLFLRLSFSRISRALSPALFLQAGRQARSNRYYTLLLRGTRAHVALGRKREDESSCIESRAGLGAPPRPLGRLQARWGKQNAPLKCQAPMLVNGYTHLSPPHRRAPRADRA